MCGYDREGSPIWYDVIGPVDPKGLFLSASKQDFIKSKIKDCEVLQRECNLQSQRVRAESPANRTDIWWFSAMEGDYLTHNSKNEPGTCVYVKIVKKLPRIPFWTVFV